LNDSSKKPVVYIVTAFTVPFYLLDVLKRSKNDCHVDDLKKFGDININSRTKISSAQIQDMAESYIRCRSRWSPHH
jgi:hypothetical protein